MATIIQKGIDKYTIHSYEVDAFKKLKISSLLQFLQESAGSHAASIGVGWDKLQEQDLFWVLSRITIEIEDMPTWGDEITVITWPKSSDNVFAYRDFLIFNTNNLVKPVVRATSAWALINIETRRPQRIELVAGSIPVSDDENAIVEHPHKVDALPCAWNHSAGVVKYSDIDMNGHVNNVRYFDWIADVYSQEHYSEMSVGKLDVNFLSDAVLGDAYKVNMASKGGGVYLNNVIRESDQKELVRTRIHWVKR